MKLHRNRNFTSFPSPAGMPLTKLPLGRNNLFMTSLFPPRESPGWGRETREPFFTVYAAQFPIFHIHVSVNDLYIPTIGPKMQYSKIGGPIVGINKSLTDTYMNVEIGNGAAQIHF
jgi:hypothetical protein